MTKTAKAKHKTKAQFIKDLSSAVKERWGKVTPEWLTVLELIGCEYDNYVAAQRIVEEEGLIVNGRFGRCMNPALQISQRAITQINKLLHEYGLTPLSISKAKRPTDDGDDADIIKNLIQ